MLITQIENFMSATYRKSLLFLACFQLIVLISCTSLLAQDNTIIVTIDFSEVNITSKISSSYPTLYQANAPALPYYIYTADFPLNTKGSFQVDFLDSVLIEGVLVDNSKGLSKKGETIHVYDTSYYIEKFETSSFFPDKAFKNVSLNTVRDRNKQTIHIYPFKYQSETNTLKVYTKFKISWGKTENVAESLSVPERAFNKTRNFFASSNDFTPKYQAVSEDGEMLIVYRNTPDSLIQRFKLWKEQVGITCHLLKLDNSTVFPEEIKERIEQYYDSIPDLLYLQLVGDFNEIPSYLYKQFLNDDFYSDTYYGFIDGNDFYPELLVGRFSGTVEENQILIEKSLFYEQYGNATNYERNVMLVASDQGENIGDDNETDWEHLRNIGVFLADTLGMIPSEYFDGSQGGLDGPGNPAYTDLKDGLNAGKGWFFYTGHGDFSLMNTGAFFTMHVKQLENYTELPIVVSAACNHGKYIGLDCMAEVFNHATKNGELTGSVAFLGSTILMSWAPPMETQDEFAFLLNQQHPNHRSSLGALFYSAQMSMLAAYPTEFGKEVMQTWILFGDPSLKVRTNQQGTIALTLEEMTENSIAISANVQDFYLSLTDNETVISGALSTGNLVEFSNDFTNSSDTLLVVATKSNYKTYIGKLFNGKLSPLSVEILDDSSIKVCPNPTSGKVVFQLDSPIDKVEIYDLSGKKIKEETKITDATINLEILPFGMYQLLIYTNDRIFTTKIQKTDDN